MPTTDQAPQSPDAQDDRLSRFRQAVHAANLTEVREALKHLSAPIPSELGTAALKAAARVGHRDLVVDLLIAGANPNGDGSPENAPAFDAVTGGSGGTLEVLIRAGANTGVVNMFGENLLHKAAATSNFSTVNLLLKAGLSINSLDYSGNTPLHCAARRGRLVPILLQAGADANARSKQGRTPALEAAATGKLSAFQQLVEQGADPLARDNEGLSAFELALICPNDATAVYVLQQYPVLAPAGKALDEWFVNAVRWGCPSVVKMLAGMGADVTQKPDGQTLLEIAQPHNEALRRVLRSFETETLIASAMDDPDEPSEAPPKPSFPSL